MKLRTLAFAVVFAVSCSPIPLGGDGGFAGGSGGTGGGTAGGTGGSGGGSAGGSGGGTAGGTGGGTAGGTGGGTAGGTGGSGGGSAGGSGGGSAGGTGGSGGGTAGGSGGAGGGGVKPDGGMLTCDDLRAEYQKEFPSTKECNPVSLVNECTAKAEKVLGCGCISYVAANAVTRLDTIKTKWMNMGCPAPVCPAVLCPAAKGGSCMPTDAGPNKGLCEDTF